MPELHDIGKELGEVPFGDLVHNVAQGIADGQRALDLSSLDTLDQLSTTMVDLIPEVSEVLIPEPIDVAVSGHPDVVVTGVRVDTTVSSPIRMSALQAGLVPTFYQFTEAVMDLKLSIQMREVETTDENGVRTTGFWIFGSHVNFRTRNTYDYTAQGATNVTVTMRPVPPPSRIVPRTITVNAVGPTPTITSTA
jgi:hypothetical protein